MNVTLTKEEAQQMLDALTRANQFIFLKAPLPFPPELNDTSEAIKTLRARLAEKEQEPVAWISKHGVVYPSDAKYEVNPVNELQPLYTAPPKREWVGLTDEEIRNEANHHVFDESFFNGAVWARGKIKEKNNG